MSIKFYWHWERWNCKTPSMINTLFTGENSISDSFSLQCHIDNNSELSFWNECPIMVKYPLNWLVYPLWISACQFLFHFKNFSFAFDPFRSIECVVVTAQFNSNDIFGLEKWTKWEFMRKLSCCGAIFSRLCLVFAVFLRASLGEYWCAPLGEYNKYNQNAAIVSHRFRCSD